MMMANTRISNTGYAIKCLYLTEWTDLSLPSQKVYNTIVPSASKCLLIPVNQTAFYYVKFSPAESSHPQASTAARNNIN